MREIPHNRVRHTCKGRPPCEDARSRTPLRSGISSSVVSRGEVRRVTRSKPNAVKRASKHPAIDKGVGCGTLNLESYLSSRDRTLPRNQASIGANRYACSVHRHCDSATIHADESRTAEAIDRAI